MDAIRSLIFARRSRMLSSVLAACLIACAPASSSVANAPRTGWGFAIADPGTNLVPHMSGFTRLGVKTYRIMTPYNAIDDWQQIQGVKDVVTAARQRGVEEIVLSFNRPACPGRPGDELSTCPNVIVRPTPSEYFQKVFPAMQALAPWVDAWGPANEPNCGGGAWRMTTNIDPLGPWKVAGYYNTVRSLVRTGINPSTGQRLEPEGTKVLSPDFCDSRSWNSVGPWISAYKEAGGGFGDAIAWHPYWGAYGSSYSTTQDLINAIGGSSSAPIWVTEVGGFLEHTKADPPIEHGENDSYQAGTTSWLVNTLAQQARITRIYYYNLWDDGNKSWDTALVANNGILRQSWFLWCWATHGGQGIGWSPYTGIHPDCDPSWKPAGTGGSGAPSSWPKFDDGAVSRTSNTMEVFYRGADGSLQIKSWAATTGWSGWQSLGGVISSEPTALSLHSNHLGVFARASDRIFQKWWDASIGWSEWIDMGGSFAGRPAVAVRDPNNMNLFARATDGSIKVKWWNNIQGWSEWVPLGGVLLSDPVAYSLHTNHVAVMGRGTDGILYQRWWDASLGWSNWESTGLAIIGQPAVLRRAGGLEIYVRDTSGALRQRQWGPTTDWGPWHNLGGILTSDPTAVSLHPNHVAIFGRGTDNQMHERWWDANVGWSAWIAHGGSLAGAPTAISLHSENVGVWARQTDGSIRSTWWRDPVVPGGWTAWANF